MEETQKIGVIDLGTNTFHLLIVSYDDTGWKTEFRARKYVALGEEGIEKIGDAAIDRAYSALAEFKQILGDYGIRKMQANGTAGLRTASNGAAFLEKVKKDLGLEVALIDGQKEAELIYLGVRQAMPNMDQPALIMDVGGGSVEFILANKDKVYWSRSFPIGVAVLYDKFHKSDPISLNEISAIEAYLADILAPLKQMLTTRPCQRLIGASGTFDVIEALLPNAEKSDTSTRINPQDFPDLYDKFIQSNLAERLNWPSVPTQRAGLIIVAMVLINFVLNLQPFQALWISKYAMKEGMIEQILEKS